MESAGTDWERHFRGRETPWDLHGATPGLLALCEKDDRGKDYFATLELPARARVAVPGCGRGHDLAPLARAGLEVTGFDIAPTAVAEATRLLRLNRVAGARVLCRDVLGILPEFEGSFDLVYDYTCFCAFPPYLRARYGQILAGMLRAQGLLLVLAFPMTPEHASRAGLPNRVTGTDLERALAGHFRLQDHFPPARSAPGRRGVERWFLWRKRPAD